jgi:hypothetical protein
MVYESCDIDNYISEWVTALCSVVFDIDVGQKVESCYPPGALSAEELAAVAFHAFPVRGRG